MPQLCLTLAEARLNELISKIQRYDGVCPLIEVRIDFMARPDIPTLPTHRRSRYIATCRPIREGGCFRGDEADRLGLLMRAARSGFDWIDLEHDATLIPLPSPVRLIRSYHDFAGMPANWSELIGRLDALPGDVTKIAVTVENTEQAIEILRQFEKPGARRRILIGMGPFGQVSRLLGHFLGNEWTYVSEKSERAAAPGHFSLAEAVSSFRLDFPGAVSTFYGVLGNPLAHSLSPGLHNRLFSQYSLNNVYLPLRLSAVDPWFDYVAASPLKFGGFSVTLPFKTDVVKFVHNQEDSGDALNTLIRDRSGWRGLNTDYAGFIKPLAEFDLRGCTALVIGAGGVAHTVIRALQDRGVRVTVVARNAFKAANVAERYGCGKATIDDLPIKADLCVNCTPVGQHPQTDVSPLARDELTFEIVYDLIYQPVQTKLLSMAAEQGLKTISGMEMFVEQAALQFKAWTGIDPDRKLVREIVESLFFDEAEHMRRQSEGNTI